MIRPDIEALAAALHSIGIPLVGDAMNEPADEREGHWYHETDAEAIIAALAAQGWRITADKTWTYPANPDHPLSASEQLDRIEADYEAKVAASNARIAELSAQAAPDDKLMFPEQAAVRAALEGLPDLLLRAQEMLVDRIEANDEDYLALLDAIHERRLAIDARLAALP